MTAKIRTKNRKMAAAVAAVKRARPGLSLLRALGRFLIVADTDMRRNLSFDMRDFMCGREGDGLGGYDGNADDLLANGLNGGSCNTACCASGWLAALRPRLFTGSTGPYYDAHLVGLTDEVQAQEAFTSCYNLGPAETGRRLIALADRVAAERRVKP